MIERLAELMHKEWLTLMAEQGHHQTETCPNRPSKGLFAYSNCDKCRPGIVPWDDLPKEVKEVNRRGVLRFFRELNITPEAAKAGVNVGKAVEQLADARNLRTTSMMTEVQERIARALRFLGVEVDGGRRGGDAR